jgi:hypothetical protein
MKHWYDSPDQPYAPRLLTNPSLDLAVTWGAVWYGWLRHSGGTRIGGGTARSYYIAVETPGRIESKDGLEVLCVVPRKLEEGQEVKLDKPALELALGQPVAFPLYSSTIRGQDQAGDVLRLRPEQLLSLPPLRTILRGGKRSGTKRVAVRLSACCTEIGTLELWCTACEGGNRWRLEFNVRDLVDPRETSIQANDGEAESQRGIKDLWPELQVQEMSELVRACYHGQNRRPAPRELTRAIETAADASRENWPTAVCRRLWDVLEEVAEERAQSPAHLARWYYLVGYCLRPGFGDTLDRFRVERLWKLVHAPQRPTRTGQNAAAAARPSEGSADYWIMWRRVAGGLNAQLQHGLFDRLRPILVPAKGKPAMKPSANEFAEMWRAAASLERLDVKQKEALGQSLLKSIRRSPVPTYAFWSLTRLGARVLLYGPLNAVLHPEIVEHWLDALRAFLPGHSSERVAWAFCLAELARRSGQRALDVDEEHCQRVVEILRAQDVPPHWTRMVVEVTEGEREEQSELFGESLPVGLRLISNR